MDYKFFRQRIRQGMSRKSAIQATRKHGKHYKPLNANSHKKWDSLKNLSFSDYSDVDQSSSYDNG